MATGALPRAGDLTAGKTGTGTGTRRKTGTGRADAMSGLKEIKNQSGTLLLSLAAGTGFARYTAASGSKWKDVEVPIWGQRIDTRLAAGGAAVALTHFFPKAAGKYNKQLRTVGFGLLLSYGLDWIGNKSTDMGAKNASPAPAPKAAAPAPDLASIPAQGIEVGATASAKLQRIRNLRARQLSADADLADDPVYAGAAAYAD